jgi:hypothetical protein
MNQNQAASGGSPPGCFSWDSGETLARNSPPTVSSGERHGRGRRGWGRRESGRAGAGWVVGSPAGELVVVVVEEQFDRRKRGFAGLCFLVLIWACGKGTGGDGMGLGEIE